MSQKNELLLLWEACNFSYFLLEQDSIGNKTYRVYDGITFHYVTFNALGQKIQTIA
jgi:hypothetical protein